MEKLHPLTPDCFCSRWQTLRCAVFGVGLLTVALAGGLSGQDPVPPPATGREKEDVYVPFDVEDACRALKAMLPPEFQVRKVRPADPFAPAKEQKEQASAAVGSRQTTMVQRNLWIYGPGEKGRLRRYFERKGIYHPDLMTGIIWDAYVARELGHSFSLKDELLKTLKWSNGSFNMPIVDEASRPKTAGQLWPAYIIQKDDLNVIHIYCDDSGKPVWCYDHDSGWEEVSPEIVQRVASGQVLRFIMGHHDDGGPVANAIQRMKNPPPDPVPEPGAPDPFGR